PPLPGAPPLPGPPPLPGSAPAPAVVHGGGNLAAVPGYSVLPTCFVAVSGMLSAAALADDDEYADVMDDLTEECEKHGRIVALKAPRPGGSAGAAAPPSGVAFIEFRDTDAAGGAKNAMHGRVYAGAVVQAVFITPDAFAAVPGRD
ncbi:MAG: hypothetical protein J3K34DRAFT_425448, partial [Monoraphidium minutum]